MSAKKSEKSKKGGKDNKNPESELSESQNDTVSDVVSERPQDIRTIIITVESYSNILPLYPVSDIKARFKYLDRDLGETQIIPITDEEKLTLNESIELQIDVNATRQIDLLASNPIFLTTIQSSGSLDLSLYDNITLSQNVPKPIEDIESLFSMYEAFTGDRTGIKVTDMKGAKKKGKKDIPEKEAEDKNKSRPISGLTKGSKTSKKSRGSKGSYDSKSRDSQETPVVKSEVYGMCVIDFIPLFYGETSFSERLLLQPVRRSCQILSTFKNFPEVTVTISVKEKVPLLDIKNVLNFTIESICNAPTMMYADMECKICVFLPLLNAGSTPVIFYNPKITSKVPEKDVPKRWPGLHDIGYNANTTKYLIDNSFGDVRNKSNFDLQEGFKEEATRLEFNYLKRNVLFKNGISDFAAHIIRHRKIVLEIYLTPKTKKADAMRYEPFSDDQDETEQTRPKTSKTPPYLHLMAVLDVAAVLYPGVTRVRMACPVKTFTFEETAKIGLDNSFFLPKLLDLAIIKTSKIKLNVDKKKKIIEKKEIKTNSKKDKGSVVKEDKNLSSLLPPKPEEVPPAEPSVQVYNEDGKPCFIIAEIEFLKPINPKRDVEELKTDLYQIQMEALTSEKTILNKHVASDFYRQTINEIVDDLNNHYYKYYENKTTVPQKDYGDFSEYIQKIGAYQTYLNSITTAATYVVTNKYSCEEQDFKNSKTYQNLISEVFSELVSEMHSVLNTLVSTGMKPITKVYNTPWDESFFFAREATEMKLYTLADRYLLERIIYDQDNNADFWFDYAIFNLQIGERDKSLECAAEAIGIDGGHKYALLLYGALLSEKGKIQEAETCFLNIMVQEAKWVEGWCMLFLYYEKCGRLDGMDMAFDMANKCLNEARIGDYFADLDNLAWSCKNIPNTIFFKTASLLLKMRLYSWVEMALAQEVTTPKYYGFVNYLLAAVSYYQNNYDHAIEHIEEAKEFQGADFAILGLSGHCLFAQGRLEEARQEYFRVIESFDRPEDIYLIYVNCAQILAIQKDDQQARKFILIACKFHQTPSCWFTAGKLYFLENDMLSAEECLNEANKRDNRHPGVWGYLTLINLKLNRIFEAEQCYQQAIRSKLDDKELDYEIKEAFKRVHS